MDLRASLYRAVDEFLFTLEADAGEAAPFKWRPPQRLSLRARAALRLRAALDQPLSMDAEWLPAFGVVTSVRRYLRGERIAMAEHPLLWIPYQSAALGALVGLSAYLQGL